MADGGRGEPAVTAADVEQPWSAGTWSGERPGDTRLVSRVGRQAGEVEHDVRAQLIFVLVVRALPPMIGRGVLSFLQPRLERERCALLVYCGHDASPRARMAAPGVKNERHQSCC